MGTATGVLSESRVSFTEQPQSEAMDSFPEDAPYDVLSLSYDEFKPYEEQIAEERPIEIATTETGSAFGGLAGRISKNRVYLPPVNSSRTDRTKVRFL